MVVVCGCSVGHFFYRVGAFSPFLGAQSWVVLGVKHTQQSAELAGLCWAMRLALRLQLDSLLLVTDSEVAPASLVGLKASTCLKVQHGMLRAVSRRLCLSRLQVHICCCPSVV